MTASVETLKADEILLQGILDRMSQMTAMAQQQLASNQANRPGMASHPTQSADGMTPMFKTANMSIVICPPKTSAKLPGSWTFEFEHDPNAGFNINGPIAGISLRCSAVGPPMALVIEGVKASNGRTTHFGFGKNSTLVVQGSGSPQTVHVKDAFYVALPPVDNLEYEVKHSESSARYASAIENLLAAYISALRAADVTTISRSGSVYGWAYTPKPPNQTDPLKSLASSLPALFHGTPFALAASSPQPSMPNAYTFTSQNNVSPLEICETLLDYQKNTNHIDTAAGDMVKVRVMPLNDHLGMTGQIQVNIQLEFHHYSTPQSEKK